MKTQFTNFITKIYYTNNFWCHNAACRESKSFYKLRFLLSQNIGSDILSYIRKIDSSYCYTRGQT